MAYKERQLPCKTSMCVGRVQAPTQHEEVEVCERKLHGSNDEHTPPRSTKAFAAASRRMTWQIEKLADSNSSGRTWRLTMYAALTTKEQQAKEKTRERESGACRRPEPSAAKCDYTKPARAGGTHPTWSVRLEPLVTAKKYGADPPTLAPRDLSTEC